VIKAEQFFTDTEKEQIRNAVKNAEGSTSGEIATMVVDRSDSYREAEILGAVLLAGILALIVEVILELVLLSIGNNEWNDLSSGTAHMFLQGVSLWTFIPLVFILFFPCRYFFRRFPTLKLPFAGRHRVEEAVRERAVRAFFEKELYRTREETGVLIFISILEHKVWILGDRGIDHKIPQSLWHDLAAELSSGLHEKRACEALCHVIERVGKELAVHFHRKTDDINELSDHIHHD
jgi:putative membrane protein